MIKINQPLIEKLCDCERQLETRLTYKNGTSGPRFFNKIDTLEKKIAYAAAYFISKIAIAVAKIAAPLFDGLYHLGTEMYKQNMDDRRRTFYDIPEVLIQQIAQCAFNAISLLASPYSAIRDICNMYSLDSSIIDSFPVNVRGRTPNIYNPPLSRVTTQ